MGLPFLAHPMAAGCRDHNNDGMQATSQSGTVRCSAVTTEAISAHSMAGLIEDPRAGAVVTFSGDVRDHDHGRSVLRLDYEAHPTAGDVLAEIAAEIAERFDVIAVAVAHRTGPLAIGDCALAAAVSSAHRGEAFAACAALVEETKARIPVWKHQYFADGTDEWVNCA
ncbi:MAG: molybdenum cofactor biosynthesis protein MoaE [Actinobacteria bacterium]|nr:molybdenum cofactor biosynthesis protein MoaE [Actinomycetota bacterium]